MSLLPVLRSTTANRNGKRLLRTTVTRLAVRESPGRTASLTGGQTQRAQLAPHIRLAVTPEEC